MLRFAPRVLARTCLRRSFVAASTRYYSTEGRDHVGFLSTLDHATGEEKQELLAELEGKELYEQYLTGPFGTIEKPVIVPSVFNTRIVGCVGGDGESAHELLWHEVKAGKPTICAECGQVFQLQTDAHPEQDPLEASGAIGDSIVLDYGNISHKPPLGDKEQEFWEAFENYRKSK